MKTKLSFNKTILKLLTAIVFLTINFGLIAQEKKSNDLSDFKIVIKKTENGVAMKCLKGCAWTHLSFNLYENYAQPVDQNGMAELNKVSSKRDSNLAHFLFTIAKTDNGIKLKGIKGTAWTRLSFSLNKYQEQAIDQNGMADMK